MADLEETLRPQFRAVLQQYTKSVRIDDMVNELIEVVKRDAPRVEIPVPVEPCNHMLRLTKMPDGKRMLVCKHCSKVFPPQ
jgi:hypothetical protein